MKRVIKQFVVSSLHLFLNNLSSENRKAVGSYLVKSTHINGVYKLLWWYSELRPIDVYLLSFPKCGRTWLRLMIGRALTTYYNLDHPDILNKMVKLESLSEFDPSIPKIRVTHDDNPQWKKPDELNETKIEYKDSKVILLVRDPRDVVVSSYFEKRKRLKLWENTFQERDGKDNNNYIHRVQPYQSDISTYLREDVGSFSTLVKFFNIWGFNHNVPKEFLLVRYEDIHEDPHRELQRVLKFIGVNPVSERIIDDAVKFASFNNMRSMEADGKFNARQLKPADKLDQESYKTRRGKVGGFADYLNEDDINFLNQQMDENLMEIYNYRSN
jgi:hypothetical protein